MKTIELSKVVIKDRIRKTFNEQKLADLSDSIGRLGLIHAPVLDGGVLVAGGRRIKAIELLHTMGQTLRYQGDVVAEGCIPYTELASGNVETIMEAELEENLMRDNLTMAEEAMAKAALHKLRTKANPSQTKQDTANELTQVGAKVTTTDIRDAILIDEHLSDPAVAKAKTKKDAMKIIAKKAKAKKNVELAALFQANKAEDDTCAHTLIQGSMLEHMQVLGAETFDVILTDPPYGVNAQDFNGQEGVAHDYNDTEENFRAIIECLAVEGYRVCKPDAHLYMFFDFKHWAFIRDTFQDAGWELWPRPLVWSKRNGLLARPDFGPRYTYEFILYAIKGNRKVTEVAPDVINVPTLTRQRRGAEKPTGLYHDLLKRSVRPGDKVLDPCAGLGPVFPVANELNCIATGIEIDPAAQGYATTRMTLDLAQDDERRAGEDA